MLSSKEKARYQDTGPSPLCRGATGPEGLTTLLGALAGRPGVWELVQGGNLGFSFLTLDRICLLSLSLSLPNPRLIAGTCLRAWGPEQSFPGAGRHSLLGVRRRAWPAGSGHVRLGWAAPDTKPVMPGGI